MLPTSAVYLSAALSGKFYHRLVKDKVQSQTQCALHPLHCGPRQKAPVLFPELHILTHVRRCHGQGLSYAVLYLDTKSAYYSIARELVMADICRHATVIEIFRRFNLGPEDLQELMAAVQAGGVMHEACSTEGIWPCRSAHSQHGCHSLLLQHWPLDPQSQGMETSCPMLIPGWFDDSWEPVFEDRGSSTCLSRSRTLQQDAGRWT